MNFDLPTKPDGNFYSIPESNELLERIIKQIESTYETAYEIGDGYIIFKDGLMIQFGKVSGIDFTNEALKTDSFTLTKEFKDDKYIVVGTGYSSSNDSYVFRFGINPRTKKIVEWTMSSASAITITGRSFNWIAIGFYK